LDWALENIPDEAVAGYSISRLDAEYISSVKRERVIVRTKKTGESPLRFAHSITAAETNEGAARVETEWRRR
jgi:hypothetical protein